MKKYDNILNLNLIDERIKSLYDSKRSIEEFAAYAYFVEPIYFHINGFERYMGDTDYTKVFTLNDSSDYIDGLVESISKGFTPKDLFVEDKLFTYDRYEIGKEYTKRKRELGLEPYLDSYSWEEFCDYINEPDLKVDNINKKILLYNLKEMILRKIASEHCRVFGHEFIYSDNQPDGHVCIDHYQGMTDYEWIQRYHNYECKDCGKEITKDRYISDLEQLNAKRIKRINNEKVLSNYYDSIPSYKEYYDEKKPKIRVYKCNDDTRLTGKRPPHRLGNLITI